MKYADYKYNTDRTADKVFAVCLFVCVFVSAHAKAQLFGGGIKSPNVPITIPATITLGQSQTYFVASVYDTDYLPYTTPMAAASTATVAADGTTESVTVDVQGTINTTGVTVNIPVTATGSGTLPAFLKTVNVPANLTEDGISRFLILSWAETNYTSSTKYITATITAVGETLNAKKLDVNAGIGSDYQGVELAAFSYPYNNAGATTSFSVRDIAGIPDKKFGQYDIGNVTTYEHQFLYIPVVAEDGHTWLNNDLGADYANLNSSSFNLVTQATAYNDYHAYGSLFQWGRCPDGHELMTWSSSSTGTVKYGTTTTQSNTDTPSSALFILSSMSTYYDWRSTQNNALWQGESGTNNPCPSGFRLPTNPEYLSLLTVAGITNYTTAASSKLKFSAAGNRNNSTTDGKLYNTGVVGCYWSSTADGYSSFGPYFASSDAGSTYYFHGNGFAVRCIKNTPAAISFINCAGATNAGTLKQGTAASGVTSTISYTGGNGEGYDIQNVTSTGVIGLTATLASGQLATGSGTLTYTITGTPNGNGTASFAINIGGQSCTLTRAVSAITIPATITLGQSQKYFVASVYDTNYLPYTTPTAAATTATSVDPDGTAETVTVNVQGTITTTGVTVSIPVTVTGSSTLPAYATTVNIPAALTEDGYSRDLTLTWASQALTTSSKYITATIAAVGGTLNAKKLDINAGIGNDYLGYLLGQFTYPYNNAGATTSYDVRDIPGIPDKMFGKTDNANVVEHNFLYLPITGEDGKTWLNNNLGADYANLGSASFNLTQQATGYRDWHAYGSLFQWGRKPDGHELINWTGTAVGTAVNTTTSTNADEPANALFILEPNSPDDWRVTQNGALWATEASANNPCPSGFRVPTLIEQSALFTAAGITNSTTAAASKLKFSVAGNRDYYDGALYTMGNYGSYWCSSVSGTGANSRYFNNSSTNTSTSFRANGLAVRCLKN